MFSKRTRESTSINASSMADIAFLLLIFFLVTTKILSDQGIAVKLPPWVEEEVLQEIPDRNVLKVYVNAANELLVEGKELPLAKLRETTMHFIENPLRRDDLPDSPQKAVVSLVHDRGTAYSTYLAVYNELNGAYRDLWEKQAQQQFGRTFDKLSEKHQKSIRTAIPFVISEAEPADNG
ncbi:MAG TPA: biopolymer transporter ExbD [Saprospiraceae bacterium]|nr:biopolymer transporter ExbD [Saprospiraceae bacterium]HMQ83485.1 biopolymer transporter ExbD [Saprospiraceae bacterium]